MDPFEITVDGKLLTLHPFEDGHYSVFEGTFKLADISPDYAKDVPVLEWTSADDVDPDFVARIGDAIENHDW
jgi:hypothetical protein